MLFGIGTYIFNYIIRDKIAKILEIKRNEYIL
jgi:hypothetical protein